MLTMTDRAPRFGIALLGFAALLSAAACDPDSSTRSNPPIDDPAQTTGRLTARHAAPTSTVQPGLSVQTLTEGGRPFGLYVPSTYQPGQPMPIVVLLHGQGGSGEGMALDFKDHAEAAGVIIVAPNAFTSTWDLLFSAQLGDARFGIDRTYIDNLLKWSFEHINVDPSRVTIGGFSDGGTYAIWLGLKNGDLFSRIVAFSPCSNVPGTRTGMPQVFISHGTDDEVAPIAACSAPMIPTLENAGYQVDFVEYASEAGNGHFVTPEVMAQGIAFLTRAQ
jgi:phospholipase/carboxylesterase